jgi:hypothetical protein
LVSPKARYFELQATFNVAKLHFRERKPSAALELNDLKEKANQLGYGIFAVKIASFLKSSANRH